MSRLTYRPDIDGLRAVAVVPVVLFHLGIGRLPGGFLGVDVFFVISGFLITSLLNAEMLDGTFSFRAFWARRIRRIVPPLLAVIAAVLVTAYGFLFRPDRVAAALQAIAALVSGANFYFWNVSGDYWGRRAEQAPLLHTWSLSVEEQFYLLFPVFLWLVFRSAPHRLRHALLVVIGAGIPLFVWGVSRHPTATFYSLPTRAWELAVGCLLATAPASVADPSAGSKLRALFGFSGILAVLASYFFVERLGLAVLAAVFGSALVIAFGRYGLTNCLLVNRPALHLGKISYSLYLWHWPVWVFAEYFRLDLNRAILLLPIYLLALGSYYLLERPVRRRTAGLPAIAGAYLAVLAGAIALARTDPFYDTSAFAEAWWIPNDCNPHARFDAGRTLVMAATRQEYRPVPPDAYLHGGLIFGEGNEPPEIVLLGDSHASMWSETLVRIAHRHHKKISVWAMDGVSPFMTIPPDGSRAGPFGDTFSGQSELGPDEQRAYYATLLETIPAWKPRLVLVSTIWSRRTESEVDDLIEFLDRHAAKTLLIEQPPTLVYRDRNVMQHLAYSGVEPADAQKRYLPIGDLAECLAGRDLVRKLADRFAKVDSIPTWDIFARDSEARVLDGRNVVYLDEDHLLFYGAELAAPRLEEAILNAFSPDAATPR